MILFTVPNKPLPLNVKGLVRRNDALDVYKSEIDDLYTRREAEGGQCEVAVELTGGKSGV